MSARIVAEFAALWFSARHHASCSTRHNWRLPSCFQTLRSRLESEAELQAQQEPVRRRGGKHRGTKQYIRVLRLLNEFSLPVLRQAIERALRLGRPQYELIRQYCYPEESPEVAVMDLDGREHLRGFEVPKPRLGEYGKLGKTGRRAMGKPEVLLEHYLKDLRLPAMYRDYASVAGECARKKADYQEYLKLLCERELLEREERAAERRLKAAKFPVLKTLEAFDFHQQPGVNRPLMQELIRGEFVDRKENVILLGESGTGKTHLATALGFVACGQGKKVRFWGTGALVTMLLEARDQRALQSMQQQLANLDLLILDEVGYVSFTKAGAELLFEVVSRCYERTSIIVTSNLPFAACLIYKRRSQKNDACYFGSE